MTVRTGVALIVGSALVALVGLAAPSATAAPNTTVELGESLTIGVAGVDRVTPARIAWGDGSTTAIRTRCRTSTAARHPRVCTARGRHVYATTGTYRITSTRKGRTTVVAEVTVTPAADPSPSPRVGWQQDMLNQVNELRAAAGVPPLHVCAPLQASAQAYSEAMADKGFFDHTGPDGSTPSTRVDAAGYDFTYVGENIAFGQDSVSSVMASWRTSPSHYANMVSASFTDVGFGWAANPANPRSPLWTQDFGAGGTC